MPRPVPADLEDALAAAPAARERFWALPPEQGDEWVRWVGRSRFPRARRRRVAETVAPLAARRPVAAPTTGPAPPALPPREPWLALGAARAPRAATPAAAA